MYAKALVRFACIAATGLSCTTTDPDLGQFGPTPESVPRPEISIILPLERLPLKAYPPVQACLLGGTRTCRDLNSHPFEACLATGKRCDRSDGEAMPVTRDMFPDFATVESR